MIRTLALVSLLPLSSPALAQEVVTVPAGYGAAPSSPPASTPIVAEPAPSRAASSGTYSVFPPRDRSGRMLIGTRHEMQNDRGLWGTGLGLFLAGWVIDIAGTAIFNAASNDREGALEQDAMAWSIVPWVGPMIQLGLQAPHPALPIMSGLLQLGGTVLFIFGLSTQHDVEVPIYGWPGMARIGFAVAPTEGGAIASATLTM